LHIKEIIVIVIAISLIFIPINAVYSQQSIPEWVKNIFVWYDDGQISDRDLVNGVKYLIDNEIILVTELEQNIVNILKDENTIILISNFFFEIDWPPQSFEEPNFEGINFAVVGDVGTLPTSLQTLESVDLTNPEVILFAGDLSYGPAKDWFDISNFLGLDRIYIALGNHEHPKSAYMEHYGMQKEFYSFDYENVHFIALQINPEGTEEYEQEYEQGSEQYKFLENDLKSASTNPNTDWIIVFFHQPMYTDTRFTNVDSRNSLQPLFDLYDVDLVLQGHAHIYERTVPLKFNNTITDDSTSSYIDPDGQIYVTIGTGGKGLKSKTATGFVGISEWSVTQNDESFGFLNLKLVNDGKMIVGEFITNDGTIPDSFQICMPELESFCSGIDLNFSQTNLERIFHVGTDLRNAKLSGKSLSGIDFDGINLMYADLSKTDMSKAILGDVNLYKANLSGANLSGADISKVKLGGADLSYSNFEDVNLMGMNLTRVNLSGVDLSEKDLTGANFIGTDFSFADLTRTKLVETNLAHANFEGTIFMQTDLKGALLFFANLSGVNLEGADLSYADLTQAKLVNVNLSGANLSGTILTQVDLTNVDLREADLSNSVIIGAIMDNVILVNADLTKANLQGTILNNADLSGANLSFANLSHTHLNGANLSGANLNGTKNIER